MPVASCPRMLDFVRTRGSWEYHLAEANSFPAVVGSLAKSFQLARHSGCINTVAWNALGTKLVTGSDDRSIVIWDADFFEEIITVPTGHRNNVFCASFVEGSNDAKFVTSAADGCVHLLNVDSGERDTLYESESSAFCFKHCMDPSNASCLGLVTVSDGSVVRLDLREKNSSEAFNVREDSTMRRFSSGRFSAPPSGTDIAFNPIDPYLFALGTNTRVVSLFDVRKVSAPVSQIIPEFTITDSSYPGETEAVSGLDWDRRNGLIVNYCRQSVIEINTSLVSSGSKRYSVGVSEEIPRQWTGRANHQTFLKQVALIGNGNFVATGGDCGNLFIWSRWDAGKFFKKIPADPYVLNCLALHPYLPILATAGIASIADIWTIGHQAGEPPEPVETVIEQAEMIRARANIHFANRNFIEALAMYSEACDLLRTARLEPFEITEEFGKNLTNKAAALMGLSRWSEAVEACNEAISVDPSSIRAFLRRCKCYIRLGHLPEALSDLEHVLLIHPNHPEAMELLDHVRSNIDHYL